MGGKAYRGEPECSDALDLNRVAALVTVRIKSNGHL